VQFNGGQTVPNGILSQTFTTVAGTTYNLSFDLGVFSSQTTAEQRARVTVQGVASLLSQDISVFGVGTGTAFSHQAFTFTADSTAVTLTFKDISPTTINIDLLLDNVQVGSGNATPTPTATPTATATPNP